MFVCSKSFVDNAQPMSAPAPTPTPVTSTEPNEVPATPRASSARKPKQSKPSS